VNPPRKIHVLQDPQQPDSPEPRFQSSVVADQYPRRDFVVRRLLAVVDVAAITMALALALRYGPQYGVVDTPPRLEWLLPFLPVWVVLFKLYGLYDRDVKRISHTTIDDLPWIFHALVIGTLLMWTYYAFLPPLPTNLSRDELLIFAPAALVFVTFGRVLVRHGADRIVGPERAVFIGRDDNVRLLIRKVRSHPEYGLDPVGLLFLPDHEPPAAEEFDLPVLGTTEMLPELVHLHDIERVVLASSEVGGTELLELLRDCQALALKVSILPELFDAIGPSVEVDDVEGVIVLGINPPVLSRTSRWLKRGTDLAVTIPAIILSAPVMLAIAIAIKLDSRGPVFFKQTRIGKGARRFPVRKFRTMVADAEAQRADLLKLSKDPNWLHLDHDPRITRVGRFLRHTSLDELPQLFNVLRGQMSLVGPRPLVEDEDKRIEGWGRSRLDLTPGLTGAWQVLGRTNIPFEEMVKLDYLYVTNWSLWTDVRLMLRTLPVVLSRRGVN
jgi:exopolysaccharide biosynthesis polyprenyl glycosylphosphotransferase